MRGISQKRHPERSRGPQRARLWRVGVGKRRTYGSDSARYTGLFCLAQDDNLYEGFLPPRKQEFPE